jgi:hypothetical protein
VAFVPESGPDWAIVGRYLHAVDPAVHSYAGAALKADADDRMRFGLLMGYALARTEAGDDPERWAERALRFVGDSAPGVIQNGWPVDLADARDDGRPLAESAAEFDARAAREGAEHAAEAAPGLPRPSPEQVARAEEHERRRRRPLPLDGYEPADLARWLGFVLEGEMAPLAILRLQLGVLAGAEAVR